MLVDGVEMTLIDHVLPTKSSEKWTIFLTNQISSDVSFQQYSLLCCKNSRWETKPSKGSKLWITPQVPSKFRTRNCLHVTIHQNKQVWIGAWPEVTEAIIEAKTESWKDLLQDAISNSEGPNMWKVIQDLNGTPHSNLPNEAMSHNGRTITSIKSKANVFIHHYASVSKMNMLRVNQNLNHQFKKCLNEPFADAPLQMAELLSAIQKMKCKGVAGSDNISPSFLKSLSPLALQELLSTLHSSFLLHTVHVSGGLA